MRTGLSQVALECQGQRDAFSATSGQVLQWGLHGKFMPGIRLVSDAHRPGSYRVSAH
jgi:hypothetical protein